MEMKELFHAIEDCDAAARKIVFTILDGEELAQKAMTAGGALVWESRPDGFFSRNREAVRNVAESGVAMIDGHQVFCDVLGHEKRLVICGGGHVSMPVIKIGLLLGFEVTVLEDRPMYADNARRAGAQHVICDSFAEGLEQVEGDSDTYFVIVTRGHKSDKICLEKIAGKAHAYIGMIGSRRRTTMVRESLVQQGVSKEVLDRVYTPIGLDIEAETPAEIAVAIMAEIIEVKNRKNRTYGYTKEIRKAILDPEYDDAQKVLATIVTRKGSAPQGVGIKMLIRKDRTCVGTIGGGCMESRIVQEGIRMMSVGGAKAKVIHVDMTGEEAEEEGMVCGGIVDVLLEIIA